ncbi:hypothetical protein ASE36_02520 [Rhizobium sp. Root274]|uniref:sensor histidine kinase n=1 Tax=unclassified Rhizobium TaxID=2613769 RepID=UPI000715131C|nr:MULTISPECIES: PAS domain-containing protein [unclassified Rhizobium]KRD32718.1 hypothetical protein ASE36_02520 [Rhizobium sp. Root274]
MLEGIGTYLWRVADDVLEWSPGLVAIYGLERPPTGEFGFYDLLHPEDRLRVEAETSAFLENSQQYSHEFRIIRPDGTIRHILDRAAIERTADGQIIAIRGVNVDITDHRSGDTEVGFRALANNIDQLAWVANREGWIYWFNARWHDYTGKTLDQMEGWGWRDVHHPDHVDRVVEHIAHCFATGEDWEDIFPLRKADGSFRWFLSRARPIRDSHGNIHSWFGTNTDVTEQRELEELSVQLQRQFEQLADAMPQLVWTADADGRVTYYNRRIAEFWPARDPVTGLFDWHNLVHPDDLERTNHDWSIAAADGRDYACDHRLRMADGSYRWHLSRAVLHRNVSDANFCWFGTATEIEDLKQSENDRKLLLLELNHRVKNTLSLVQAIATLTFRSLEDPATALGAFHTRLSSLARTHDLLVRDDWQELSLKELVLTTTGALGVASDRIDVSGDDVRLSGRIGVMVAMAIHELGTNAVKYGALSNESGVITIRWETLADVSSGFQIEWKEAGGPLVHPPSKQGFGSKLIRQALASTIEGEARFDFEPDGLKCIIWGRQM